MIYHDASRRSPEKAAGRRGTLALAAAALALATFVSATALAADSDDEGSLEGDWSQRLSDRMKDAVGGAANKIGLGRPAGPPPAESPSGCPTIALLPGTEAQRVTATGQSDNQGVRYQYSLATVGRECTLSPGRVTIKVGAEGRVLLGPAGSAGRFDVPIRVAVFDDLGGKVVESRLFKVAATVPPGQSGASFTFVSDAISLALPNTAGNYSIKVGLDAVGKSGSEPAKVKHPKRRTSAPDESASR